MESSEAIFNGLKDIGIDFIVSVPCVNLSKLLNMIDEDEDICGEALEDCIGGYTFVDILELFTAIYDTLDIEPDNRLAELIDKHLEERAEAEKAAIELAEKKQTERNVGYIGIDSLFTLDMDCYYYEDEEDIVEKDNAIVWECGNCGFAYEGKNAVEVCPVCAHPKSYFFEKPKNY